jgi:uncharacterized protein (TIGR02118 family)
MVVISVMYPTGSGSRFDFDYYLHKHVPLVDTRWGDLGLRELQIFRGVASLEGGGPAFHVTALLTFGSIEEFQNAMSKHGAEIIADIVNFTDSQPALQINEPLAYEVR